MAITRYILTMDERGRGGQEGKDQTADLANCAAFNHAGEFAEEYFRQGIRVLVSSRPQTGSYVNKKGQKVCTTRVILNDQEFANSKGAASEMGGCMQSASSQRSVPINAIGDGFMNIPNGVEDGGLPFSQSVLWLNNKGG